MCAAELRDGEADAGGGARDEGGVACFEDGVGGHCGCWRLILIAGGQWRLV